MAVTPDDADLEALFKDLAANISKTGATGIVIDETVNPDFIITSILPPSKGTATSISETALQWKIDELGVSANEGASLEFFIKHTAKTSGEKLVNQSIEYKDNEGNAVVFPKPVVTVDCGVIVNPEPCPIPVALKIGAVRILPSLMRGKSPCNRSGGCSSWMSPSSASVRASGLPLRQFSQKSMRTARNIPAA